MHGKAGKGSTWLIESFMPGVQKCRELANALAARAMLKAGQNAADDAWQDLLACLAISCGLLFFYTILPPL